MGDTSTRHLDLQQPRIFGETPQSKSKSNIHARSTMSSPNGQTRGLQEDNRTQTWRNNRRPCGATSQPWPQQAKEETQHSLERRNMVQGQAEHKTTKATNCITRHHKPSTNSIQPTTTITSNTEEEIHREEARETRGDGSKQGTTAKQCTAITISNRHSQTKGGSSNRGPLDPWRTPLEKSSHQTQNRTLHTATNTRWTRCDKTEPRENNNGQTNIGSKMVQNWRWLDNKTTSNFERPMDWLNKLWGERHIQGWGPGWGASTTSKASKRTYSTSTTYTTRASRTRAHTPSLQELVSNMCSQQRKSRQSPETEEQNASGAIRLLLLQDSRRSNNNSLTTAILTGIDVETGMVMATMLGDKQQDFQYHVNCIQSFLMECGRVQAVLNSTILQSDQEDHLIALLQKAASKMGGNITVRQSPTYSSQAQGSVERIHRTLMGQIRTLRAQLQQNYDRTITSRHPIVPWMVRRTAYLRNRYATHADGNTSYFRRWNKDHRAPICEFGETVQYLLPTVKQLPKMEQRFFKAIWLGRDTSTGETLLGIGNKVVRARTIRRMPKPDKYDKQMFDIITGHSMIPPPTSQAQLQPPMVFHPPRRPPATMEKQTSTEQAPLTTAQTNTPQLPPKAIADTPMATATPALASSPMATAPTSCHSRQALPSPTKRCEADDIAEGSSAKQQPTNTQQEAPARPEPTPEQPKSRLRITKVTIQTKQGEEITAYSCEDATEQQTERILLEPIVNNTDGLDKQKTIEGMKQEILSMKQQQVYMDVDINTLTPEQRKNIIQSRWVLRDKGNKVRARIVAKGFTETINDLDDIYASTPIFCVLRTLLTLACNNGWIGITGDISTAFLPAAATADLYMYPPKEFYNPEDNIVWKLLKAIYGLRSSPKAWQKHLSEVLQQIGLHRSTAEPNIYMTTTRNCFVLAYVDDLLFLGEEETVNKIFKAIQQQLPLRPTGTLSPGNTVAFLGRNITNRGDHYEISLSDEYVTTLLTETKLQDSKPAPAPGTSALKAATADHDQDLSTEEHSQYRRAVGKLQWMTYTRPDISYATKELARALQQPTTADQQKLKHLLRYIKGTKDYKQIIRPTVKIPAKAIPDINVYVDSDWAGCPTTRRSTTGFLITLLGTTINYGSRTQATIALSSAEAELYAINTGATEALHIRSLLIELLSINKINIKIHTDSSSGKSMATRIGSSRKAKHIELKHLFIQQLISHDYVRLIKIHTNDNPADILTKYVSTETLQRHLHQAGLSIQLFNTHWSNRQTVSPAACNKQAATSASTAARALNIQVSLLSAMGSTMVDRSFALTTSWSISTRYPIKYFNVIFDMYYFNMSVHHMKKNMCMSHTTCL